MSGDQSSGPSKSSRKHETSGTANKSWGNLTVGGAKPLFAQGQRIAERYEVLNFIARGGVGEVYEVKDGELDERVALKILRQEEAAEVSVERFKREINLARQVTHPNVCRLYEFGQETRPEGRLIFLTMELLEGETLYDRIRRLGPMTTQQALPLVRQMADGLEAAQQAGVIHRDFKSSNVMLVPVPESPGEVRAVVTDFGLARAAREDMHHKVTQHDSMLGTPAYMAPEQVESGAITAATDLYAVGVVLYEMLTGRYPFEGETALITALKRLNETPTTPRSHVPQLPMLWEAAILRCLEREPERRFATPSELVEALDGKRRVYPMTHSARRFGGWGAAGLLIVAALWLVASRWRHSDDVTGTAATPFRGEATVQQPVQVPPASDFETRPSLALLGFRNLSGAAEDAWLATALAELLATEAAAGDGIRVVPGENVARARLELGLEGAADFDEGPMDRLAELIGSDLVAVGTYLTAGTDGEREIRLDLTLRETDTGNVVARTSHRGTESAVLDLVEVAGRELRDALGLAAISAEEQAALRAVVPDGTDAVRLYAEGLDFLRRYEARQALERLQLAAEKDPENAKIQSAMSTAWLRLGYWPQAREAAHQAFERAAGLPKRDRLWVEAQYYEISRNREQAMKNYALLWDFFPDNLEYGLQLAKVQISMGMPDRSVETLNTLRRLPPPSGNDPRIDLADADAARALSIYPQQQLKAAEGAAKAEALGDRLLMARAREIEAAAWRDLGEPEKARQAYEQARSLYDATNNRGLVARVLVALAKLDRHLGNLERAKVSLEEARRVAEEIGDQGSLKHGLNTLAIILRQQGELGQAQEMHLEELKANEEVGDRRGVQITLTSLGVVARQLGDLEAAEAHFEKALNMGREIQSQRSVAINTNLLGEVRLRRGDLERAQGLFEQALEANEELGNRRGEAYYFASLADAAAARGDLATARERHQSALEIRQDISERTNIANSQIYIACLDLEEGKAADAERRVRLAIEEFEREGKPQDEAFALALLARALAEQGHEEAALTSARQALQQVEDIENRGTQLRVWIETGIVLAKIGHLDAGQQQLERASREARQMDFVDLRWRADLHLGQLLAGQGDPAARDLLQNVAHESRQRGYLALAEKAETSLQAVD